MMWSQKARCNWIKSGDRNTTFFHKIANTQRKMNHIHSLQDCGKVIATEEEILRHMDNYFKDLFGSRVNTPSD